MMKHTQWNRWIKKSLAKKQAVRKSAGLGMVQLEDRINPSGEFGWALGMGGANFDQGHDIVSRDGFVYITGAFEGKADFDPGPGSQFLNSVGSSDIFVAKYTDAGSLVWAKQMGGASTNLGLGIAVDGAGNVYTTGSFEGTVDFDPGLLVVNLKSFGSSDIFVTKLDSTGNLVWAKQMGGAGTDAGNDIAVDSSGNVYTTGSFEGKSDFDPALSTAVLTMSAGSTDIFVSKLNSNGDFVWAKTMGGTSGDVGNGIAVDGAGNVYTTGYFQGTADFDPGTSTVNFATSVGGSDIFVSKLDSGGNHAWAKQMGGASFDAGNGIAVDGSGNVYTTGYFQGTADFDPGAGTLSFTSAGSNDIFISKLDSGGNLAWAKQIGGTGLDAGNGIAVDDIANVYTTGSFQDMADFDPGVGTFPLTSNASSFDIFVSKLDYDGNLVWAKQMGGASGDVGNGIALDSTRNVYTTGNFQGTADFDPGASIANLNSAGSSDIFVSKLYGYPVGTLLATISDGHLYIADIANKANNLTVSISSGNLVIADTTEKFLGAPDGWTLAADGKSISIPAISFSGMINIQTTGGNDTLTVDHTGGVVANSIEYNGGAGGFDTLTITGGSFATGLFLYTGVDSGTIGLVGAGPVVYSELEPVLIDVDSLTDATFHLPNTANAATLTNAGSDLLLSGAGFEDTTFTVPTGSITFIRGIPAVDLEINNATNLTSALTVGTIAEPFDTVTFTGGAVNLGSNVASIKAQTINVNSALNAGTVDFIGTTKVNVSANITGGSGGVFIGGGGASPLGSYGVSVSGATITAIGLGNVSVIGNGSTNSGGLNVGVNVQNAGTITSSGGNVFVRGVGGAGAGSSNHGVIVTGSGSQITSNGGAVLVEGYGGGTDSSTSNIGVFVVAQGQITNAGTGAGATVTVVGYGGNTTGSSNSGVYVTGAGSQITSNGGAVFVYGYGGGTDSSGSNYGVYIASAGQITNPGTGAGSTVTVTGKGGNTGGTGGGNYGVYVRDAGSQISGSGGAVQVDGFGGGSTSSGNNIGVIVVTEGQITNSGSGVDATVTVIGKGSITTGSSNTGVLLHGLNTQIASNGGAAVVQGYGGGTGSSSSSHGVSVQESAQITSESGNVNVWGRGGFGTGSTNFGVYIASADSQITANGGAVLVEGIGGGTDTSSSNFGVILGAAGRITNAGTGAGATVTVIGKGGNTTGTGGGNFGVHVVAPNSRITSSGGAVLVQGTGGGAGSSSSNTGVALINSGTITNGGTGAGATVTVIGQGGNTTGTGDNNPGIFIADDGSQITSNGGAVLVQGTGGGAGSSIGNGGVVVVSSGKITNAGTNASATVTVIGLGGNTTGTGNFNHGVAVTTSAQITSNGGVVRVEGTGGGANESIENFGVLISTAGQITSAGTDVSATVTVIGQGGNTTGTGGGNFGVYARGDGTQITSSGGPVQVEGTGGGAGTGGANRGVFVESAAVITSAGTGEGATVTVIGQGGSITGTSGGNIGVFVFGVNSRITSSGGAILVEGTGGSSSGDHNHGVGVAEGGQIISGSGAVSVTGIGGSGAGNNNYGVNVAGANSRITSHGGAVLVDGTGGGSAASSNNTGVYVQSAGEISNTGTGAAATVTVVGQGGNTTGTGGSNFGVIVSGMSSQIAASGGALLVEGTGGGAGTSGFNAGVFLTSEGQIRNSGTDATATVTVIGQGGNSTGGSGNSNIGINVSGTGSLISSSGGAVLVEGTGGGAGSGNNNFGVFLTNSGLVLNTGTDADATITVVGQAGSTASPETANLGVLVTGGSLILSSGGAIDVTGIGTVASKAILIISGGTIASLNGASITLTGDSIDIIGTGRIDSGTGTTTIQPRTAGTKIDLGGLDVLTGSPLTLGLTTFELSRITAGKVIIGNSTAGELSVNVDLLSSYPLDAELITGSDLILNASVNTGGGTLVLDAGGTVQPVFNGTDVIASQLSFASGTRFKIDIQGVIQGTDYSQLHVQGDLDLTGAELVLHGSYVPEAGDKFTLIENDGIDAIVGTFSDLPEGATVMINGVAYTITYVGGTGNDVVLVPAVASFDVQRGQSQRSYIRYLDLELSSSSAAEDLLLSDRVRLVRFERDGSGPGVSVGVTGLLSVTGNVLTVDFGTQGIGGNRNSNAGDGYYVLELDLDGDGIFETQRRFFRLLGDVNGDRVVNVTDVALINGAIGSVAPDFDVNGDGVVNGTDRLLAQRHVGRSIAFDLEIDD